MEMRSRGNLATRALETEVPIMVKLAELSKGCKDAIPLAKV